MTADVAISVVLPVYRTRRELPELHRRLRLATGGLGRVEVIFVNDACPDGSLDVLREIARADAGVTVLTFDRRRGQHEAICEGLAVARGNVVVIMDADLQDPPEAVPALVAKLAEGFGAVYAGRRGCYESRGRLATSWLFKHMMRAMTGMPADAGGFVAMSRGVAARAAALRGTKPYLTAAIALIGRPVATVPVSRHARVSGRSAYTPRMRAGLAARAIVQAVRWRTSSSLR